MDQGAEGRACALVLDRRGDRPAGSRPTSRCAREPLAISPCSARCGPASRARRTATASRRAASPASPGTSRRAAAASHASSRSVRDLGRRRRNAGRERQARLQRLRDVRRDGASPERLQRQLRRHRVLRLRGRRLARRADRPAEVGQVPAGARARAVAAASSLDRCVQRLGRPRVRQRLLPRRARHRDLPRGGEGVPRLHAGVVQRAYRGLPQLPLGQERRALLPRRPQLP